MKISNMIMLCFSILALIWSEPLLSLNIKKGDWKNTWIQVVVMTLPGPEIKE